MLDNQKQRKQPNLPLSVVYAERVFYFDVPTIERYSSDMRKYIREK